MIKFGLQARPGCQVTSTTCFTIVGLSLAFALAACSDHNEQTDTAGVEASASASVDSEGNVTTREASSSEIADLRRVTKKYDEVDAQFPLPAFPTDAPRLKAAQVLPTGEILLVDGRSVMLDGVACTGKGIEHLRRWFTDPGSSLVIVPTTSVVGPGAIPVNLWVVETGESSESRGFPADAGISSGWCRPQVTSTATLNDRYAALAKAFEEEWPRYAEP